MIANHSETLASASDNCKRIERSITRRQRGAVSLDDRYQVLLNNYQNHPDSDEENLPLHFLLLYLKGLAEMINNWTCQCTLDEILDGEIVDIIKDHLIPEMAAPTLLRLQQLHQQAIDAAWVEKPVSGYDEMLCLSSCIGSNCPWKKGSKENHIVITIAKSDLASSLSEIFNQLEETIMVIVELAAQFEQQARTAVEGSPD